MSARSQLRIWKEDIQRYWGKTSFMGRILLGAALSLLVAGLVTSRVTKPLAKELDKLKPKASGAAATTPEKDSQIRSLEKQSEEARRELERSKSGLEELRKRLEGLDESSVTKLGTELRAMIAQAGLELRSETPLDEAAQAAARRGKGKAPEPLKPELQALPEGVAHRSFHYVVDGSFGGFNGLLQAMDKLERPMRVERVKIVMAPKGGEPSGGEPGTPRQRLRLEFDLTALFLKK